MSEYQSLHDLPWSDPDHGWTYATVDLAEGDAAPNPASTTSPRIYGPARVTYLQGPDGGIRVEVKDLP